MNSITTKAQHHLTTCYGEHLAEMPDGMQLHISAAFVFGYNAALRDILIAASKGPDQMTKHIIEMKSQIIDYQKAVANLPENPTNN